MRVNQGHLQTIRSAPAKPKRRVCIARVRIARARVAALRRLFVGACLTPVGAQAQAFGAGWHVVAPGGKTRCAFDTPFEFWVREADPSRLLVYLQGGGVCWDHESCRPGPGIAFDSAIDSADLRQRRDGAFDRANGANPFRNHTVVFVPYCTGDLHLGARRVRYDVQGESGTAVTVNHVGSHNLRAVLDYLASRPAPPRFVTVVGASAGAVASPVMAAEVARLLPAAEVRQVGDGAGAARLARLRTLLRHWGADSVVAALGMPLADSGDVVVGMYRSAAARHPRIRFSQVSTSSDAVVSAWLRRFGDDPSRVSAYIDQTYGELRAAPLCFTGFVLPGTLHTILWRPEFLTAQVAGRSLAEQLEREVLDRPCPARVSGQDRGDAAFLFAYRAKADMDAAFAAGYRRHLDWHSERGDSLAWLAWTVIDGPGLGTFIDGTFGIPFKAFDARVDPRADAEDGARNVTAYATPVARDVYRLRRDLGTSARLEEGRPAPMQKVVRLVVRPGGERAFEDALRSIASRRRARGLDYAVYERVSGGELPAFVLIVQFPAWSSLEGTADDPGREVMRAAGSSIVRAESETWLYRPELTYFPKR